MPIARVGDLVTPSYFDEPSDWDALGIIVGMGDTELGVIYEVLWHDMPEPKWCTLREISVMRDTDTEEVNHGNRGD